MTGSEVLAENEYYALMVKDEENRNERPRSHYLDFGKAWLGLERTSEGIYVSKTVDTYWDPSRGQIVLVRVKPTDSLRILGAKE